MNFLKYTKIYFIFSGILILGSLLCLGLFGLKPSIEFSGGSILEIEYIEERPSNQEIQEQLSGFDLGGIVIQPTGDKGVIIRMKDITEETHQQVIKKLKESKELEQQRYENIGPVIGQELKDKTRTIIAVSLLAIVLYIAFAFRKIQRPIKSWQYGLAALIALGHDVLIPLGVLAVLGEFYGLEISIPIIVALLTILGYSINNTVVVFDRIRENILNPQRGEDFKGIVNISLHQTLTRSINTSLTTLFVLSAIFFFGGETLKYFALALIMGIIAGTYSSLFLASPVLVYWLKRREKI
ncbi:protein translocase subunit SecF [Candidatus Parcubacteria bacterium]|nr:protein translocase subunit SecF [Candidatus Parcubacteria bacterium]